jgi:competence protein ComEC
VSHRDVTQREAPADLRLVAPSAAVWAGTFVATGRGAWWVVPPVLLVVVAAVLASRRVRSRRGAALVAVVALCLVGGLLVGGLHREAVAVGEVQQLGRQRVTATATAVVTADPRRSRTVLRGPQRPDPLFVMAARLERLTARGRSLRMRVPVLLLARDRAWSGLLPGQRVRLSGRLGPARAGQPVAAVLSVRGPPSLRGRPSVVQRAAGELRGGLRRASNDLPTAQRGLLPGLVVGDTSRMPDELEGDFRTAGLTHLTAVSGANLAIVTGFVLLVGRHVGVRGRWLPVLAAVAMVGFVVLARPQPSVIRAAAMGLVGLAALASGLPRRSLSALGTAVVVLLLLDPWLSRSYGFALSVLATGGLVLIAPGWARRWHRRGLPRPLAQALAVPLAAQLACAPVIVMLSGEVSLVAVPANLLAAPAVPPATVLGVLATLASVVHGPTAEGLAWLAGLFVWWVVVVAQRCATVSWAAVDWSDSVPGALLLAVLLVSGGLLARLLAGRLEGRPVLAAAAVGMVGIALVVPATTPGWPPPDWRLAVCDVGQGDVRRFGLTFISGAIGNIVREFAGDIF